MEVSQKAMIVWGLYYLTTGTWIKLPTTACVLLLSAGALGWRDLHQLQQGDGGYHDHNLLGGMFLLELFAAHWVIKEEVTYRF